MTQRRPKRCRRHRLRHGDRVAYAAGPTVRRLELVKHKGHFGLGTVVFENHRERRRACVIWDDAEVSVDDVEETGLLWRGGLFRSDGCAYAVVTPESRRTTQDVRRMRAVDARRRLAAYLATT